MRLANLVGGRQHVRQRRVLVGDVVDVEEQRAGDVLGRYSALAIALGGGQMHGAVENDEVRAVEMRGKPVCVSTSHWCWASLLHAGVLLPGQANATRMRRFMLALLLDLGDDDRPDLAGAFDMRAAAGLQVDARRSRR